MRCCAVCWWKRRTSRRGTSRNWDAAIAEAMRKQRSIAAVAVARKLAVRLWWMWIRGLEYGQLRESVSHAG